MSGHFYLNQYPNKLGCWEIYHEPMNPNLGIIDGQQSNYFQVFVDLGLISPDDRPYNILLQNEIDYNIYLPPIESISKGSRYSS